MKRSIEGPCRGFSDFLGASSAAKAERGASVVSMPTATSKDAARSPNKAPFNTIVRRVLAWCGGRTEEQKERKLAEVR